MPEVSRFYGIIVRIFTETQGRHHLPHVHVYYQAYRAVYSLGPIELLTGSLPKRQQRLVEAWMELYQDELLLDWQLADAGLPINRIPPLKQ